MAQGFEVIAGGQFHEVPHLGIPERRRRALVGPDLGAPSELFWKATNARITFNRRRNGLVTGAVVHWGNGNTRTRAKVGQASVQ